ncbi:carbohydrate sulfotransferase 11-like isoform X3 [Tigriopus californicus]|nr:carbohydrate sulfotransferase 11-like isoform X3 [Tigriopus californicus]
MDAIQYHVVGFTSLKWLWCPTFVGLAESNWVHNFMVLMGLSPTDIEDADSIYGTANPVTLVRLWAPELTKKSFALTRQDPDWKSILFVQHPIHRLVAFYQNNLEEYHDDSYYNLGIHIVETYRDQAKLRFQDFVQTVDDFKTPIELPHFWEYIQFVLDRGASGPYNLPHLIRPIYRLCDVCPGNYQYIVKTESIAQEDPFLFQKLGFPSDFQGHTTNKGYKYEKLMKDAPKYLEKISLEDQKRLHEMYRLDFELFGYHMKY